MIKKSNSKIILNEHSKAKLDLYSRYLAIYLNVVHRARIINKIYLFDLFAGEGIYKNDEPGSPIITMEKIKHHYFANNKNCIDVEIFFNEPGISDIERGKPKIDRIKQIVNKMFCPNNVKIQYSNEQFENQKFTIRDKLNSLNNDERALLFVDPWGYKEIHISDLNLLLENGKSEIILFLPTSFMYRFAEKALNAKDYPGGKSLKILLKELFPEKMPHLQNQLEFIELIRLQFLNLIDVKYVDRFTIERELKNFFCLYFFTNNIVGLQKMLEAKWKLDESQGRGFRLNTSQAELFGDFQVDNYKYILIDKLKTEKKLTNYKLKEFGLLKGYLPKHTKNVLHSIKDSIKVQSLDSKEAKGFYIDNSKRKVLIEYIGE